jgi:hypothetical protein
MDPGLVHQLTEKGNIMKTTASRPAQSASRTDTQPSSSTTGAETRGRAAAGAAEGAGPAKRQRTQQPVRNPKFPADPTAINTHIRFFDDRSKRVDYTQVPAKANAVTASLRGEIPFVTRAGNDAYTDSHFHPTNYVQRGILPAEQLAKMAELGIRNCVLMPIPTSLQQVMVEGQAHTAFSPELLHQELGHHPAGPGGHTHAHAHHCGAQVYYIPKDLEEAVAGKGNKLTFDHLKRNPEIIDQIAERSVLYVDTAVNSHLAAHLREAGLTAAQRSRLDPMLTGVNLADIRSGEKFLKELYLNKGTFTGIGEITVHKELVQHMYADQRGQATTQKPETLAGLKNLLQMAGAVGAPVVLHCDIDDLKSQIQRGTGAEPLHFEGLKSLFQDPSVKDTTIVWAHGGGLGRFVQEGEGHLERLAALLKACPNLNLDISWSEVAKQINKPEALAPWAKFIEQHSDRICFGSDSLAPRSTQAWDETKKLYQNLLSQLPPAAKHNVLNGTYERVFVQAREKVRDFENKVLTPQFHREHLMDTEAAQPVSAATVRALANARPAAG